MNTGIDIFSEYIDNFGDLTIPIRLANDLASLYEEKVNLFISINDLSKEVLRINRLHKNINLYDLHQVNFSPKPSDRIITIFDTKFPNYYEKNISTNALIINYEYFSCEEWVNSFHLKQSLNKSYKKINYFPGISLQAGAPIYSTNDVHFFQKKMELNTPNVVSFFSYYNDQIYESINNLTSNFKDISIVQFDSNYQDIHLKNRTNNLMSFNAFDSQLLKSGINFVRGEDSLIRAILSGVPFIWQPYNQSDNLHLKKLEAFIDLYFIDLPDQFREIFMLWNSKVIQKQHWKYIFDNLNSLTDLFLVSKVNFLKKGTGVEQIYSLFI